MRTIGCFATGGWHDEFILSTCATLNGRILSEHWALIESSFEGRFSGFDYWWVFRKFSRASHSTESNQTYGSLHLTTKTFQIQCIPSSFNLRSVGLFLNELKCEFKNHFCHNSLRCIGEMALGWKGIDFKCVKYQTSFTNYKDSMAISHLVFNLFSVRSVKVDCVDL